MRRVRSGCFDENEEVSDRVEKLMGSWVSRFRLGSTKNKPLLLSGEDPKVARLARMAPIFYELLKQITSAKGKEFVFFF